jgi:hypothetical protein
VQPHFSGSAMWRRNLPVLFNGKCARNVPTRPTMRSQIGKEVVSKSTSAPTTQTRPPTTGLYLYLAGHACVAQTIRCNYRSRRYAHRSGSSAATDRRRPGGHGDSAGISRRDEERRRTICHVPCSYGTCEPADTPPGPG